MCRRTSRFGDGVTGIWVGLTGTALISAIGMVQVRCWTAAYPCGDWPEAGFTWHIIPVSVVVVTAWFGASWLLSYRTGEPLNVCISRHGSAARPTLALLLGYSWYGLTGSQYHPPSCRTPILCHDVAWYSFFVWTLPFLVWAARNVVVLWVTSDNSASS